MTRYELRRIAQIYGATEQEVREAEYEAVRHPLIRLGRIRGPHVQCDAVVDDKEAHDA